PMQRIPAISLVLLLAACQQQDVSEPAAPEPQTVETEQPETAQIDPDESDADRLARVLENQPENLKVRYDQRHPRETLEFFGVEPGMTVVEALPGGGWYTRILLPYLGADGHLIGANYALEMWPLFAFGTEAFMIEMRRWRDQFPAQAEQWCEDDCASVSTFWLGSLPEEMEGSADVVMFVRALHNLARFNAEQGFLDDALADAFAVLKPGGTFGVVQHWARDDMPDDWADGDNGYLKRDFVIDQAEAAGFEFVEDSNINANSDDQPSVDEYVWRLPPTMRVEGEGENEALMAEYEAIGESHRMTLKFRKPE
ncbi:MAG: class I SAM-dependent methyltransferase, partial [Wenzhouxiangellaceae bacterium]|nr:class I SAM-dependent methyltransferase [Wenzhouxiangellaceae bacterium]